METNLVIGIKKCSECARRITKSETPAPAYDSDKCSPCHRIANPIDLAKPKPLREQDTLAETYRSGGFMDIYTKKQKHQPITGG